jgi:hypothetical protein
MKPHLKQKQEIHLKASNRDIIQKYRVWMQIFIKYVSVKTNKYLG